MTIKDDDAAAAAVTTAPRVTLADIEERIAYRAVTNGLALARDIPATIDAMEALKAVTIAIVVLKSGFVVIGTSAPASAANYDKALGERLAYEHCVRQLWPLMGFELRQKLYEAVAK